MNKYKITLTYDGTQYSGWQIQPNTTTIQEKLQDAIRILVKHTVSVIGAGRTDAGVHALGQVAHFKTDKELDLNRFITSLNGILPKDIRVKQIERVPLDFHARFTAKRKVYHYHLHTDQVQNPFKRLYSYHTWERIDIGLLKKAAQVFVGTHDFTSYANDSSADRNPVRTIDRLDIVPEEGGLRLVFEAQSFLYKMVRNIVGMLLDVSRGKRDIKEIEEVFAAKDRRQASQAAPALGLFLVSIDYEKISNEVK